MRKSLLLLFVVALAAPASVMAEVNVNVNVGVPVPGVVVAGPPAVLFQAPPLFLAPRQLGFYVGVDVPYDIVFASNNYYLYFGNAWYRSGHYNGPWAVVAPDRLPPGIRKHRVEYIRSYRDDEYRTYSRQRERYPGRYFREGKERKGYWKEERRREREEWQDDRHREKEEWKNERHRERQEGKEYRKEYKGHEGHGRGHDD